MENPADKLKKNRKTVCFQLREFLCYSNPWCQIALSRLSQYKTFISYLSMTHSGKTYVLTLWHPLCGSTALTQSRQDKMPQQTMDIDGCCWLSTCIPLHIVLMGHWLGTRQNLVRSLYVDFSVRRDHDQAMYQLINENDHTFEQRYESTRAKILDAHESLDRW